MRLFIPFQGYLQTTLATTGIAATATVEMATGGMATGGTDVRRGMVAARAQHRLSPGQAQHPHPRQGALRAAAMAADVAAADVAPSLPWRAESCPIAGRSGWACSRLP